MKNINLTFLEVLFILPLLLNSCKKEFLDKKPATNLNVPTTLSDMQLLLDNTEMLNRSPAVGEASSDDYNISYEEWTNQYYPSDANTYVWSKEIWSGRTNVPDWNKPYTQVLYANVVLEQLENIKINAANHADYNNIKGSALFLRAWSFFDIAQVFSLPYDINTANTDLGIPLRLTADINVKTQRSSLEETYGQILSDAKKAKDLLINRSSQKNGNRPSKMAAFGLLSRIYLTMRDYPRSGTYADSALQISNTLMDYNTLDTGSTVPFNFNNVEVIYQNYLVDNGPLLYLGISSNYSVDTLLYKEYAPNDLRKVLYFYNNQGTINRKNNYSGALAVSNGLTTDEMLITRAECSVRDGHLKSALDDLNRLLGSRWITGTYVPYNTSVASEALEKILLERRKELIFRGLRWSDVRRLNKEGQNITLKRVLNGQVYTLLPNHPRYALPIPPDVISLSKIQQNDR